MGLGFSFLELVTSSPHNILPRIVLLTQVEGPADFRSLPEPETFGKNDIGQSGNFFVTLLNYDDSNTGTDDASTDGFTPVR
jgi:hypothetical protein